MTIASIRGRTRGGGAELAAACDMRFASLERAIFGQPEVGAGLLPGGGGIERLPLLVGRARALEIILGSDDFDAATAAAYGWINRALPDAELDDFVDTLARRIASFDKAALSEAKRLINRRTLPSAADLIETQDVFLHAFTWRPAPSPAGRGRARFRVALRSLPGRPGRRRPMTYRTAPRSDTASPGASGASGASRAGSVEDDGILDA